MIRMYTIYKLLLVGSVVIVSLGCSSINIEEATTSEKTSSYKPDFSQLVKLMPRDQPYLKSLFRWDDRIIAHADKFYFEVDVSNRTAVPIRFVGRRTMVAMANALRKSYALGEDGGYYYLFFRSEEGEWEMIYVPETDEKSPDSFEIMTGNNEYLVLLGTNSYMLFDGKSWKSKKYSNKFPHAFHSSTDTYCTWNGKVYLGRDSGEWGGGLFSLDLVTGKWTGGSSAPGVQNFCVAPDNSLWIVRGEFNWYGTLTRLTTDKTEVKLKITEKGIEPHEWKYEPAYLSAIQFNEEGQPILLTGMSGLLQFKDNRWQRLNPECGPYKFPRFSKSLLILEEGKYLVGTVDAGMLVLDTIKREEAIIRFSVSSFYQWKKEKIEQGNSGKPD